MSIKAMLVQSMKHKAKAMHKLIFLTMVPFVLASCLSSDCGITVHSTGDHYSCQSLAGLNNISVKYNLPVAGGSYDNAAGGLDSYLPSVTFSDTPGSFTIIMNGADISADFVDSGDGLTFSVVDGNSNGELDVGEAPNVNGAIRDGRNTFQVTSPVPGSLITFYIDAPGTKIHITSVDDGWNGVTRKVCRGDWVSDTQCDNYDKNKDPAMDFDTYDIDLARVYYPYPKRGNIVVTGYLEGEQYADITRLRVEALRLPTGSTIPVALTGDGVYMEATPGTTVNQTGGYYLTLDTKANGYGFSFNLRDTGDHDSNNNEEETDVVRITACKNIGGVDSCAGGSKSWLRSSVPLSDTRLGNSGGLSIAFDQAAMLSTGEGVADMVLDTNFANPAIVVDAVVTTVSISRIIIESARMDLDSEGIFLTFPDQNNPSSSVLDINANLPVDIYGEFNLLGTCRINDTSNTTYNQGIQLTAVGDGITQVDFVSGAGLGLNISISGGFLGSCAIAGAIVDGANDIIQGIIKNTVGGVIANDLPTTRMKLGIEVAGGTDLGPFYLPIQPKISEFYGQQKTGFAASSLATPWKIKWGMDVAVHTRGVDPIYETLAVRNASLGSAFTGANLQRASLNLTGDEADPSGTTLGVTLSEDFFNQLFMGLWESGTLYLDFAFDSPPDLANPFLTNVTFSFTSAQPWEWNVNDNGNSTTLPNTEIRIPDLLINLTGDLYYPVPTPDQCIANGQAAGCTYLQAYEFARMLGDVTIYAELTASPDGKSLRLRMTQALEVDVYEVSSDWDGTTEEQLLAALDSAFVMLTGGLVIDIPFPEILTSDVNITDVSTNEDSIFLTIDVFNPACFPAGPDVVGLYDPKCLGTTYPIFNWPANTDSRTIDSTGYTYGNWSIAMEADGYVRVRRGGAKVVEFGNGASAGGTAYWQGDGHLVFYNPAATWASGWPLPDGTNTAPKATDSLILLSDGRLLIYDNQTQVVRYTFPRLTGSYLSYPLAGSSFSEVNTSPPTYGGYPSLVNNNVSDAGGDTFHMSTAPITATLGNFDSGFMCPVGASPHPASAFNEIQRARSVRQSYTYGCGWDTCTGYNFDGTATISWTDPGGTTHSWTDDAPINVADVQAAFNARVGTGNVVVSGVNLNNDSDNRDMFFTFQGIYAGLNVNQVSISKTGNGSITMSTTSQGGPKAMGTAPITGDLNYCYGATDGIWTVNSATAIAANGSAWNPQTPNPNYVVALQGTADIQRTFSVSRTGKYELTFLGAQRAADNNQSVTVELDGVQIGTVAPEASAPDYYDYSYNLNLVAGQNYTLRFRGNPPPGDHTVFVDNIRLVENQDQGFSMNLGQNYFVTGVNLDGRDDCCQNRIDGYRVELYKAGKRVGVSPQISGGGAGVNLQTFNYVEADEVRVVKKASETVTSTTLNFSEIQVRVVQ